MPSEEGPEAVPPEPARRLFFALWPDEAMRDAMAQATREAALGSGGRPVPAANLHVTLAFLGSVAQRRLARLREVARAAALDPAVADPRGRAGPREASSVSADRPGEALALAFDHLEYWRGAQLLCAAPAESPAWTAALAGRLQARLAESGFAPDLKSFRPHVTVARKIERPGPVGRMPEVTWRFTELVLVESRTLPEGPLYSVAASWPLWAEKR